MAKLSLEVGKYYTTRQGHCVKIISKTGLKEFIFQSSPTRLYDPDGQITLKEEGIDHPDDIIAEWPVSSGTIDHIYYIHQHIKSVNLKVEERQDPVKILISNPAIEVEVTLAKDGLPIISYVKR